jgi:hypothetical protein
MIAAGLSRSRRTPSADAIPILVVWYYRFYTGPSGLPRFIGHFKLNPLMTAASATEVSSR